MPIGVNPDVAKVMGIPTTIESSGGGGPTANSGVVAAEIEKKPRKPRTKKAAKTKE